jgi:hypothetical protein
MFVPKKPTTELKSNSQADTVIQTKQKSKRAKKATE